MCKLGRPEIPLQQKDREQEQESDSRFVFMIFPVLRKRKTPSTGAADSRGSQPRDKQRHGCGLGLKGLAVLNEEFTFFASHHHGIDQGEVYGQNCRGN